jgi:hexosaminidase
MLLLDFQVVTAGLHTSLHAHDVVQFWHEGSSGLLATFLAETPSTNRAILSAYTSYYLDCGTGNEFGDDSWCDPYKTWRKLYFNDPLKGVNATAAVGRVLGGEVALWSEVASAGALDSKLWPRAAAYGGRLWNYPDGASADWVDVELALAAHASRLAGRGISSDQIMPQFCQQQPHLCFPGKSLQ